MASEANETFLDKSSCSIGYLKLSNFRCHLPFDGLRASELKFNIFNLRTFLKFVHSPFGLCTESIELLTNGKATA